VSKDQFFLPTRCCRRAFHLWLLARFRTFLSSDVSDIVSQSPKNVGPVPEEIPTLFVDVVGISVPTLSCFVVLRIIIP
jgi:hypothetical protein